MARMPGDDEVSGALGRDIAVRAAHHSRRSPARRRTGGGLA
ncbi:hypothetical protein [Prauserella shujinwangii]|nr:hypothetical protein [Prauserella shujinwangii]